MKVTAFSMAGIATAQTLNATAQVYKGAPFVAAFAAIAAVAAAFACGYCLYAARASE